MKKPIIRNALGLLTILNLSLALASFAQTTNFTPVQMKMETGMNGVFVRFNADVGRIYQLLETTDLINWTVIQQMIGSDTNMSFYVPLTNILTGDSGTATNEVPPPPGFSGMNMITDDGLTEDGYPLPLLPWEWDVQLGKQSAAMQLLSNDSATTGEMESSLVSNLPEAKFYRVLCPEDRIQFPQWQDFIDQYLYFDVWTSIQGTYHLELWADGQRLYSTTHPVPSDGRFGVYDGAYDPADWPYAGFYVYNQWELRVTVTPSSGFGENASPATTTVTKIQRRPKWYNRSGVVAQQDPTLIFRPPAVWAAVEEDFDYYMDFYFASCYNGATQFDLNWSEKEPYTSHAETLTTAQDWSKLKAMIFGTNYGVSASLSDLHYFGHGAPDGIGGNGPMGLRLSEFRTEGVYMTTNPMFYVVLDGCRTSETPDLLQSLVGYRFRHTRADCMQNGWQPGFGWGWKNAKGVAFFLQGTLVYDHFDFVADYYDWLCRRDQNAKLFHTFQQSIEYAKDPNGRSLFNPATQHNFEGDSINWVGCTDCKFDQL